MKLLTAIAFSLLFALTANAAPAAPAAKSVVFVHGAFADGSSWAKVIPLLEAKGIEVISVQNPLTSLADDVAHTKRAIALAKNPVVLVGHSWGGAVITEAGTDAKVAGLVFVAAGVPDAGGSFADATKPFPPPAGFAEIRPDAQGFAKMTAVGIEKFFAPDLKPAELKIMTVTQGPIRGANFEEKVSATAWSTKPSWYIVAAKDQMIHPDAQRAFAAKIKAKTTTLETSHVPMLSQPAKVAAVIIEAVNAK